MPSKMEVLLSGKKERIDFGWQLAVSATNYNLKMF